MNIFQIVKQSDGLVVMEKVGELDTHPIDAHTQVIISAHEFTDLAIDAAHFRAFQERAKMIRNEIIEQQ